MVVGYDRCAGRTRYQKDVIKRQNVYGLRYSLVPLKYPEREGINVTRILAWLCHLSPKLLG